MLGRIVEVVSGVSLDQFVADRIAKPLGLSDTGFYVPAEKLDRLAETQIDPTTGKRWPTFDVTNRPNWLAGGSGMVSTAWDYVRFAQMLLNGGELDQVRLLSPRTVSFMTSDHLWPGVAFSPVTLNLFEPLGMAPTNKLSGVHERAAHGMNCTSRCNSVRAGLTVFAALVRPTCVGRYALSHAPL